MAQAGEQFAMLKKNKRHNPTYAEAQALARKRKTVLTAGVIALVLGGFYILSLQGPKKIDYDKPPRPALEENPAWEETAREAAALKETVSQIKNPHEITPEQLAVLEKAMELQKQLIREKRGSASLKEEKEMERLQKIRDDYHGKIIFEQSRRHETQAEALMETRKWKAAASHFMKACSLQKTINDEYSRSEFRNLNRSTRLKRKHLDAMAAPEYEEIKALEKQYQEAFEAGRTEEAKNILDRAIFKAEDFIERHRGTRHAEYTMLDRLEAARMTLASSHLKNRIETHVARARELEAAGQHARAAEFYNQARQDQLLLNEEFPKSGHTSKILPEELRLKSEKAANFQLAAKIKSGNGELDAALRRGDQERIPVLLRRIRKNLELYKKQYGQSPHIEAALHEKTGFLASVEQQLPGLRESLLSKLIPAPGKPRQLLLAAEVTQRLYESVMENNPSRHRGAELPVESVSWNEAAEFCRRAGWILGRPVFLPSRELFMRAAGEPGAADIREQSWNASNSGMATHPAGVSAPNASGFYDLLGNVSEWLAAGDGAYAVAAGGSAQDSLERIREIPLEEKPKKERNRFTGFRAAATAAPAAGQQARN